MSTINAGWIAHSPPPDWSCDAPPTVVFDFHRSLVDYEPTRLVDLPTLAEELGVARVFAKDESRRLGLPAFKALGASWAIHQALRQAEPRDRPETLMAATDGNHGRAVARFARLRGHPAQIWVPGGVQPTAIDAIKAEGAVVTMVDGSYDQAVGAAAAAADELGGLLIQDTAWDGYRQIPGWIVQGYATMFFEIDEQFAAYGAGSPHLVAVPVGVGSLAQAALAHYRSRQSGRDVSVVSVEPDTAACVYASLAAGSLTCIDTRETIMAGLNCGTPSEQAWPYLHGGLNAAVRVTDSAATRAMNDLATLDVDAGPCGAAGLAGVRTALTGDDAAARRDHLRIDATSTVLLLITEGSEANRAS
jgi:diaminopropionate ammonia-lyase